MGLFLHPQRSQMEEIHWRKKEIFEVQTPSQMKLLPGADVMMTMRMTRDDVQIRSTGGILPGLLLSV